MVSYNKPQSLRSAVQLGIPDAIHQHGKPMKLSDLVSSIQIILLKHHPLMRVLIDSGYCVLENPAPPPR